ncbi:ABC transporter ATP-binding protein [Anoxynatronum sibiricum]|uniref:ABC transporter ATP-binding protein n=1 Tax=Anoxynatronum sibiricum TaxID=210623 RepID=A0ABU9VT17_9CLOT
MIRCEELTKDFGGTRALNGCSFQIEGPSLTGVIGVNGAGKTTLFKTLAGFLRPSSGGAFVLGEPAFQNINVAQNVVLNEGRMTFYANATLQELMHSYSRFYLNFDEKLAKGLLDYFQLDEKRQYSHLSKGMASTFRLIITLAARAPITLLDEPATGMDPTVRKDLYEVILKDYIKVPRIILIASHYLGEMEQILENMLLIHGGKVMLHSALEDFQTFLVALQGSPQAIRPIEEKLQVYEGKDFGPGIRQIVVKREAFQQLQLQGEDVEVLKIAGISLEDSFIYLTQRKGGGIDELYHS